MKKNKKKINTSKVVIIFSFLLILVIILYTALNSRLFNSENVEIEGNKYVKDDYIIKALDIKNDKNIFRYNIKDMEANLLSNKYIDKVEINRVLPNTLKINITEKKIVANLYNEEVYCYIDKEGNFIDKIDEDNKDNDIVVVYIDYDITNLYDIKFKNEQNKKRLLYLLEYIIEEGIYIKIDNINMTKEGYINMRTKDEINILLNNDEDLKYNISRLSMILVDLQNKNQKGGEIDLSIGKNAIYRP